MRPCSILAMFGALMLAGCSSEQNNDPTPPSDLLAPPAEGTGLQYRMVSRIEPGQEIERCQLFVAPATGLAIRKDEVRYTAGSHHVLLYKTPYTQIPTTNKQGQMIDGTKVHDCAEGASAEWKVNGIVAGSQSAEGDSLVGEMPEGVAIKVDPGTVLLMDTHYLNATSSPVDADARINLYTMPPDQVKTEAGVLFLYNPIISIPANGTSEARMRCPVSEDISIIRVQSHMHRRGVGFTADLTDDKGASISQLYTNTAWENVPAKEFEPLLKVKAGQGLDYRCEYKNTEARSVVQGQSTKDEMCMLIGPYFPRNPDIEQCQDKNHMPADTWIGSGTASCMDTLACAQAAKPSDQDQGASFYGCILNSCPGVANETSEALRCQMTGGFGACAAACQGMGSDCATCIQNACAPTLTACQAAKCN